MVWKDILYRREVKVMPNVFGNNEALDMCKCQHVRENHYMGAGKCFHIKCGPCLEFSLDNGVANTKVEKLASHVPTKDEVMAAGYTSDAADRVIARETKMAKEVWE
jgi:hypothetical protein